ncbi:MAG: pyruvate ferredoxin oxidoreductase [Candidatus Cloacimonetes bacterium 4572_65]|nr:MAG: pyruvate ferredoxin oxidoreductase [Candidatus Cloacimonetes bacterium 4572_65]
MKKTKDLLSQDGNRPVHQEFKKPAHISEYPVGPSFTAGHLADTNAGWRVFRPVVDNDKCVGCMRCYMLCPDGVIFKVENNKVDVDFDYCKGCGVCAFECPVDAIKMTKEQHG